MNEENKNVEVFKSLGKVIESSDLDFYTTKTYSIEKDEVYTAVENGDIPTLRGISLYFYNSSGLYRHLIHKIASIDKHRYMTYPMFSLAKNDKFNDKIHKEVSRYVHNYNVEQTSYNIDLQAILYGECYTYETRDENFVQQQILPPAYCRTRKTDAMNNKLVDFDFSYFDRPLQSMDQALQKQFWTGLPKEFLKLYKDYKNGKISVDKQPKWQPLDQLYARCYRSTVDGSPLFSTTFTDILESIDLKNIDSSMAKSKLFRLLVQKFEINKETGFPFSSRAEILDAHQNLKKASGDSARTLTTGFEVNSVSLQDGASANQDIKYTQLGNDRVTSDIGIQQSLIGSTDNVGAEAIKQSIMMISESLKMLRFQHENWIRKVINTEISNGKVIYQFTMLDVNIFNETQKIKDAKQQLDIGGSVSLLFNTMGIPTDRLVDIMKTEDSLGIKELFKPLINSNQMASDTGSSDNGRPKTDNPKDSTQESDQNRG
ncbi:MAG: hypothetical protein ACRC1P_11405 [Cellulosilyticaceae bacterium]